MRIHGKYNKQTALSVLIPSCPRLPPTSKMHTSVLAQVQNGIITRHRKGVLLIYSKHVNRKHQNSYNWLVHRKHISNTKVVDFRLHGTTLVLGELPSDKGRRRGAPWARRPRTKRWPWGEATSAKTPREDPKSRRVGWSRQSPSGEGTMAKARGRRMALERARPKEGRMIWTTEAGPEGLVENVKQQRSQSYGEVHLPVQL